MRGSVCLQHFRGGTPTRSSGRGSDETAGWALSGLPRRCSSTIALPSHRRDAQNGYGSLTDVCFFRFLSPFPSPFRASALLLAQDQQNAGPIVTVYNPGELRRGRKLQENPEAVLEYGDTPWKRLQYVQRPEYLKQLRSAAAAAAAAASAAAESVKLESAATEDQKRDLQGSGMLVMNFEDCIFQNCSQGDFKDKYATYGVISSLTAANVVNVKNCIFAYNVFNGVRANEPVRSTIVRNFAFGNGSWRRVSLLSL